MALLPRFYAGLSPTVPFSHLRPWGNLGLALSAPYGGTSPKGGAKSRLPPWGALVPSGHQRLTEPAGESGLALARTERASCQPHRPLPWLSLSGRRFLGVHPSGKGGAMPFLFRLPPIKVKGKVEAFLKKSFTKKLYARFARPRRPWCPPLTSSCWPASCAAPWRGCPCACGCSWASLPPARPRR